MKEIENLFKQIEKLVKDNSLNMEKTVIKNTNSNDLIDLMKQIQEELGRRADEEKKVSEQECQDKMKEINLDITLLEKEIEEANKEIADLNREYEYWQDKLLY